MIGFPVRHRVGDHLRAHALEGQASVLRFTLLLLHPLEWTQRDCRMPPPLSFATAQAYPQTCNGQESCASAAYKHSVACHWRVRRCPFHASDTSKPGRLTSCRACGGYTGTTYVNDNLVPWMHI